MVQGLGGSGCLDDGQDEGESRGTCGFECHESFVGPGDSLTKGQADSAEPQMRAALVIVTELRLVAGGGRRPGLICVGWWR